MPVTSRAPRGQPSRRRDRWVWLVLALTACASTNSATKTEDLEAGTKEQLHGLVRALHEALVAQEAERLNELLTADAVVLGVGPGDVFTFRDTLVSRVRQEASAFGLLGGTLTVKEGTVHVGVGEGEASGWIYDAPAVDVLKPGMKAVRFLPRLTGHVIYENARWRFDLVHLSLGLPDAELYAADAPKKFAAPTELQDSRADGTDAVIELAKKTMEDVALKGQKASNREEFVVVGTDPGQVYVGGRAFKDLLRPMLAELKKQVFTLKFEGGVRARLGPTGKTAWVAGNVVLRQSVGKRMQTLPTLRQSFVFAEENGNWVLVQDHQSLGLKPDQRPSVLAPSAPALDGGS